MEKLKLYGNISKIPSLNFFYGMKEGDEVLVDVAPGKTIIVSLLSVGPANDEGMRTVFFRVNGQTRNVSVSDKSLGIQKIENRVIDPENPNQIGSPLQGMLSKIFVKKGQKVKKNDPLFIIEAMKMETTITATFDAVVDAIILPEGSLVNADDLVLELG
jgi:pyruvate carboxylase